MYLSISEDERAVGACPSHRVPGLREVGHHLHRGESQHHLGAGDSAHTGREIIQAPGAGKA